MDNHAQYWDARNSYNIKKLREQVDYMVDTYSNTKIKDIDTKMCKNGIEYVKSMRATFLNINATYGLKKHRDYKHNVDIYKPIKTYHYQS